MSPEAGVGAGDRLTLITEQAMDGARVRVRLDTPASGASVDGGPPLGVVWEEVFASRVTFPNPSARSTLGAIARRLMGALGPTLMNGATPLMVSTDVGSAAVPVEALQASHGPPLVVRRPVVRVLGATPGAGRAPGEATAVLCVTACGDAQEDPTLGALGADIRRALGRLGPERVRLVTVGPGQVGDGRALIRLITGERWHVMVLACHGELVDGRPRLRFGPGVAPFVDELPLLHAPDLMLVNACVVGRPAHFGQPGPDLVGLVAAAGVRCLIAPCWPIPPAHARLFGATLVAALVDGWDVSEAVRRARQRVWEENPEGGTWSAWWQHGGAGLRLVDRQ